MAKILNQLKLLPQVAVTTAGTAVPLSVADFFVYSVTIQRANSNAGLIYVGEADVSGGKCIELSESTPALNISVEDTVADEDFSYVNLKDIYIDAQISGEKVNVAYVALTDVKYNS